ncbi:MAG: tRNA (adenosine(37)-N6)-dimethylallyltransferase MiaA [Dongiaceae bacterium]
MTRSPQRRPDALIVAGPTASGKSAFALAIAERLGGTLINADSMQLYRDLAVLTARPDAAALARAPHRLFGSLDAADACSVGRWLTLAETEIAGTIASGRLPVLVGGTGLYFRALTVGLAAIPPVPAAIRDDLADRMRRDGAPAMHARLAEVDPATAARLAPRDGQRILRALAVEKATGRPLSAWLAASGAAPRYRYAAYLLDPPRAELYAACDARLAAMMAAGAIEEARALLARKLDPALPAMKAIGVAEIGRYLAGSESLAATVAATQQATRRYAKRQITWFRHQMPEATRLPIDLQIEKYSERFFPEIFSKFSVSG